MTPKSVAGTSVGARAHHAAPDEGLRGRARRSGTTTRRVVQPRAQAVSQEYAMNENGVLMPTGKYCVNHAETVRRKTRTVNVGNVKIGSEHPIVKQTMTTSDTRDVAKTVAEVIRCADAGAEMVRITVQGMQEAKACVEIKNTLVAKGYNTPLIADIHFAPKVALLVAECFDKIRVNPGNFADGRKKFENILYETDEEYEAELAEIEEVFTPLVLKCKERGVAMRIGTNHGSLSARTLSRFGDTPMGMVESAFEFARICRKHDYHNFVFSMKASNPLVMVQAYRLLSHEMYKIGWDYPLHLGVTEAGEGEDGRMKSSIGIGALLLDGLGDTIRVSLTEASELEIEPCTRLANLGMKACAENIGVKGGFEETVRDFKSFTRRTGDLPVQKADDAIDFRNILHRDGSVLTAVSTKELASEDPFYRSLGAKLAVGMPLRDIATSDSILLSEVPAASEEKALRSIRRLQEIGVGIVVPAAVLKTTPLANSIALVTVDEIGAPLPGGAARMAVTLDGTETAAQIKAVAASDAVMVLIKTASSESRLHSSRRLAEEMAKAGAKVPVIHHMFMAAGDKSDIVIQSGSQVGGLLVDGFGDGVLIQYTGSDAAVTTDFLRTTSFGLLQGSRMRNTKTEYVSCPSCGRTLFDLQEVTAQIQEKTGHLPGVAIAVMGCIVNGPGEMADADFGYVGGAPGKIDLYVGKEVVKKGIPSEEATEALIELIKENDRWVEKEVEEVSA
uniref:4-hydroxy-3-methylbut-2-en-1-yl diphosphate synthase (ferredoxin), chloroplastic n=1 Tax=Ostreococcus mediterraneus TaxID=1486918 RepID=A0A7S0KIH5_9CHLO